MANIYYATIGDIWKHLPLAEILSMEQPVHYWESHAGNACYQLTHSEKRDFGIYYFLEHTQQSQDIDASLYTRIVNECAEMTPVNIYPGSPLIAMSILGSLGCHFLFCDTDATSIFNISEMATHLGLAENHRVHAVHRDGIATLQAAFDRLPVSERSQTLVFMDPYNPMESSEYSHTLDLFCEFTLAQLKTVLWLGFSSKEHCSDTFRTLHQIIQEHKINPEILWLGWIALDQQQDGSLSFNPGVWGCAILCGNISNTSLHICKQLGNGLKQIYAQASLPGGGSGALRFSAGRGLH